jgi:HEAT repeat protein
MTIRKFMVRTGGSRSAPRAPLVLLLAGTGLLAAATLHVVPSDRAEPTPASVATDASPQEHASALLNAARGANPLLCRLAARTLHNRWGGLDSGLPGPESIGSAADATFEWAVSADLQPETATLLRGGLTDPDGCVRRTAAALLGRLEVAGGLGSALRAELASGDSGTRHAALLAIGYAGHKADVSAVSDALDDADHAVRLAAVWALGQIGDRASVPSLVNVLKDQDAVIRATAAYSLGRTESAAAIPALAALLADDGDARVRRAAAAALGQIDQ